MILADSENFRVLDKEGQDLALLCLWWEHKLSAGKRKHHVLGKMQVQTLSLSRSFIACCILSCKP